MPWGNLVDEIVVQGIRQGASSSLSRALSGALAGSVARLASSGALGGLSYGGSAGALQDAVSRYQPPSSVGPTEVAPVEVMAPAAPGVPQVLPAGALGQAVGGAAGASTVFGNSGVDTLEPANDLEGIEVVGARAPPPTPPAPGTILGATGGSLAGVELSPVEVQGVNDKQLEMQDLLLPAAAGAGLLTLAGGGGGGEITPEGDGGGGFKPTDLLPLAPLIPLIPGIGGGGGDDGNKDALEELARNNSALADRLGRIATAGFAGDIGGRGLNSINRMVRKAQAAIRQRYASMNMSGSSAEIADLNAAAEAGVDLQFKVGQEMAQHGLTAIAALTGQSASIYAQLLNAQTAKNTALGNALANFAGALVD